MAQKFGLERLGFLTLTFADDVQSARAAQRRFNSLASNVLRPRYGDYCRVLERQGSGRIHYHLLINTKCDIRSNVDFAAFARGDYSSASQDLKAEWRFWRETAPLYSFGRHELMPIRSTHEGISKYVGKYIGKSVQTRRKSDRGVRLVDYSRGARLANTRFAGVGIGARNWRARVAAFAALHGCVSMDGLRAKFGPWWAWNCRDAIMGLLQNPQVENYTNERTSFAVGSDEAVGAEWLSRCFPDAAEVGLDFDTGEVLLVVGEAPGTFAAADARGAAD